MMDFDRAIRLQRERDERARQVQAAAGPAFARLLEIAEKRESGPAHRVARFLACTFNGEVFPLDPSVLRAVDVEVSDDMLVCLDAFRWGPPDLHHLVPDGGQRVRAVLSAWGLEGPKE